MSNLFNHLLSFLCVADDIFLLSNLLLLPVHFGFSNGFIDFVFPFLESSCHFALSASIFLIITITIERWQAVCFPYFYQVIFYVSVDLSKHINISRRGLLLKVPKGSSLLMFSLLLSSPCSSTSLSSSQSPPLAQHFRRFPNISSLSSSSKPYPPSPPLDWLHFSFWSFSTTRYSIYNVDVLFEI